PPGCWLGGRPPRPPPGDDAQPHDRPPRRGRRARRRVLGHGAGAARGALQDPGLMADYDLIVIGGRPAGYAAALTAAERGASVALAEPERLGGACVNSACIPTNILLSAATTHVDARELGALGVFGVDDQFNLARAAARKDALVRMIGDGIATALTMRKVALVS